MASKLNLWLGTTSKNDGFFYDASGCAMAGGGGEEWMDECLRARQQ